MKKRTNKQKIWFAIGILLLVIAFIFIFLFYKFSKSPDGFYVAYYRDPQFVKTYLYIRDDNVVMIDESKFDSLVFVAILNLQRKKDGFHGDTPWDKSSFSFSISPSGAMPYTTYLGKYRIFYIGSFSDRAFIRTPFIPSDIRKAAIDSMKDFDEENKKLNLQIENRVNERL